MTQTLRKAFDLGITATIAIVILNFAASSIGIGQAEAQADTQHTVSFGQTATFEIASFNQ